jgi:hypothetical protein
VLPTNYWSLAALPTQSDSNAMFSAGSAATKTHQLKRLILKEISSNTGTFHVASSHQVAMHTRYPRNFQRPEPVSGQENFKKRTAGTAFAMPAALSKNVVFTGCP